MRFSSLSIRARVAILAGLAAVLALAVFLARDGGVTGRGASPEALNSIAARNEEAATVSAARMKEESEATTRAADARIEAETTK